uniref:Uncharacterized protein n=1 Tax=Fagus sylvatica TaxID=28930 RepID=A0A2N9EP08_FAGSY
MSIHVPPRAAKRLGKSINAPPRAAQPAEITISLIYHLQTPIQDLDTTIERSMDDLHIATRIDDIRVWTRHHVPVEVPGVRSTRNTFLTRLTRTVSHSAPPMLALMTSSFPDPQFDPRFA